MPPSPVTDRTDLVTFRIKVGGADLSDLYQVRSIEVNKGVNRISSARLEFNDGSVAAEDFPLSDSADLLPGTELSILAGYHTEDTLIYKGLIVRHGLEVGPDQSPLLIIECRDAAAKLAVGRKSAVYADSTDSDAIEKVIGSHGVAKAVDATTVTHPELVQYYCTDWDFVVARAEANGLVVLNDQGKLTVTKPDTSTEPVLTLTYGADLNRFAVAMDARDQYPAVKGQAWDYKTQQVVDAEAKKPGVTTPGNVTPATLAGVMAETSYDLPLASAQKERVQAHADALLLKSTLAKVKGTLAFQGSALVNPGSLVTLAGMGQRFNGTAYVAGVRHTLAEGEWTTEITLGLDEQWFAEQHPEVAAPSSLGPLPGIQGLYNAVIKQIHEDPGKEFRVQVTVPALLGKTLWARLGHPYASSGSGQYFYPEVGDEVILGFFNNDPQEPVVLGSLYSSGRAPAYTPTQKNELKGWVTPNKLTVELNDDKKIITLKTPGSNTVVLDDNGKTITLTDAKGNKVQLSDSGILLDSQSNLTLKAMQNIKLEATQGITLSASGGDVKIEGLNVNATGQIGFKAAGNATAELSAAGQTTVKGAIVMIN